MASEIICDAAIRAGLQAKKSEVHGMAQRGGVVTSHVRLGETVTSPLMLTGEADVVLGFEQAESIRWLHVVKQMGTIIMNTQKIVPPIAFTLGLKYPDDAPLEQMKTNGTRVIRVDAAEKAQELGDMRFANTILVGMLSALPVMSIIPHEHWEAAIRERFASKMPDQNVQAFTRGRELSAA